MTENQKLREAFESRMTDNGKWPNAIKQGRNGCYLLAQTENAWTEWQACAEALALPTADHLPDAGEMVVDHFPDATKMIETAAPVGELPELPEPFALSVSVHDGEHCKWPLVECMLYQKHPNEKQNLYTADQMRAYARAALSAGDAVDAQRTPLTVLQYNAIPELCAIPPSLYESVVRAIERAHGIDAAMRKDKP